MASLSDSDPDVVGRSGRGVNRHSGNNARRKVVFLSHRIAVLLLFSWEPGNDGSANGGAEMDKKVCPSLPPDTEVNSRNLGETFCATSVVASINHLARFL